MKKYLLGALALPLAFAACTNDDFESINNESQVLNGETIELPENFALIGAKQNADTRAGMINNHIGWFPVSKTLATLDAEGILDENNWDHIGLAWLNMAGAQNGMVYTNYDFTHYGWLNSGATGPEYDKCENYVLENGVWFTGDIAQNSQFKKWDKATKAETNVENFWSSDHYEFTSANFANAGVDNNRGLFRTSLGTIFGGDYLVYYPYNPNLKDVDYLKAISTNRFTNAKNDAVSNSVGLYTGDYKSALAPELFNIGRTSIKGGTQASQFNLGQLSGMIAVKVANNSSATIEDITSVTLYAKDGAFYTSVPLNASLITDNESVKKGTELYTNLEKAETTTTLISKASDARSGIDLTTNTYTVFGFAALPTTIKEYIVIVQDKDGNSFAQHGENLIIPAGAFAGGITVNLTSQLNSENLYAYDESSFATALIKANNYVTSNSGKKSTINLLGTVELNKPYEIKANVTVKAMTANDKLVITRQKEEEKQVTLFAYQNSTLDCDVDIQGVGCCNLYPGLLNMNGSLAANRTIKNFGSTIVFGQNAQPTNKVTSIINGTINNTIDKEDEAKTPSSIVIEKYTTVSLNGTLNNEEGNSVTVATAGTTSTGEDGTLNIYANGKMLNNGDMTIYGNVATENGGVFENYANVTVKVSAQITGKGVTYQDLDAAYICEVNSLVRYNDAINNSKDAIHFTTLVRFIDTATPADVEYTLAPNTIDGKITNKSDRIIDFESAISAGKQLTLNGKLDADGVTTIPTTIGKLTIVNGGLTMKHANLTMAALEINHKKGVDRWTNFQEVLKVTGNVDIANFNPGTAGDNLLSFEKGVEIGGNLTVNNTNSKNVEFAKGTTSTINGGVTVAKMGMMKFEANSVTTIKGDTGFDNNGKVDITPQTAVDGSDVAARVICKKFTNFGDTSKWLNGSYPQNIL